MRHCKRCLLPDTRPGSIFDKEEVCQACRNYEKRNSVDWEKRMAKLKKLCAKYRREDGYYDCIIPVSGGKDSHFLVYMMKVEMGMNPILITIGDPFTKTEAGLSNFRNLGERFNCDHFLFNLSPDLFRRVTRIALETTGEPLRFVETAIYTVPLKMAVELNIPLVVFGENPAYEYGSSDRDSYAGLDYILPMFKKIDADFWLRNGISRKEMNSITPPSESAMKKVKPEVIFMGYFTPWSSANHLKIARKYGFRDLTGEWQREGCIDSFEQIDSVGYMVHHWMKYPKFGFQRTADIVSRNIRESLISPEEGKKLIAERDHILDKRAMSDFIGFLRYTPEEFWKIVERFWNPELFVKTGETWRLKDPVLKK